MPVSDWGFFQWAAAALLSPVAVYLLARLVSAAYFKSKQDHEATRKVTR